MAFVFLQPPYSPKLNLAEQIWRILKKQLVNKTIHELSDELTVVTNKTITDESVKSITYGL